MGTAPQTAVVWMVGGAAVDTSSGRISATGDTLSFSPLATSDTGSYTCELTVTAQQSHVTVQAPQQSAVEDITVQSNLRRINYTNILQAKANPNIMIYHKLMLTLQNA